MKYYLVFIISFIFNLQANSLPTNKIEFCQRFQDNSQIKSMAFDLDNFISFKNNGGLFNGGVCWWHSRFQRNALYLTILDSNLPKPSEAEAKTIIKEIRNSNKTIVIPGYKSFQEFTNENQALIQKELNSWQLYDGVVLGGWIDGLKGETKIDSELLRNKMNELNEYVAVKNKIGYVKLQIKGITSHAWLIIDSKPATGGQVIGYIDSNWPLQTNEYQYKWGDQSFNLKSYGDFVPYLEFTREEEKLNSIAQSFCNNQTHFTFNESDYWQDLYDFDNNL
jgi:hypothetical protein